MPNRMGRSVIPRSTWRTFTVSRVQKRQEEISIFHLFVLTTDAFTRCHNCGQYLYRLGHCFYAHPAALERSAEPKHQDFRYLRAGPGLLCLHIGLCPAQIYRQPHSPRKLPLYVQLKWILDCRTMTNSRLIVSDALADIVIWGYAESMFRPMIPSVFSAVMLTFDFFHQTAWD